MHPTALDRFVDTSDSLHRLVLTAGGVVLEASPAVERHLRLPAAELVGSSVWDHLAEPGRAVLAERLAAEPGEPDRFPLHFRREPDVLYTLSCMLEPAPGGFLLLGEPAFTRTQAFLEEMIRLNEELTAATRESVKRNAELERALHELETSYWHIRKIQEALPICMQCDRVKTESSRWEDVAQYLKRHSLFLSHGYCPPCAARLLKSLDLDPELV